MWLPLLIGAESWRHAYSTGGKQTGAFGHRKRSVYCNQSVDTTSVQTPQL